MELKKWMVNARVPLGMLVVQLIATGLQLLSKVILNQGTFIFALIAYRHIVAALCVAPFALCWERGVANKLSPKVFFLLFMVALTGIIMAMGFYYYGLKDTTATYAINFLNLIPIVTFLLSIILRIENLGINTWSGRTKTLGAMLCLAGTLTVALYKGHSFYIHSNILHGRLDDHKPLIIVKSHENRTRGTILLTGSCISYALWFILQVKLFKVFPYKYWATMLTCIIATVQAAIIGVCIDRTPTAWHLAWNLQLVTILYSGMLATSIVFCLISWAISQRGPTYPSMFNPLALILIAISEALFLGEPITVGSLICMWLIVIGLYSFLWGKRQEYMKRSMSLPKTETGGGEASLPGTETSINP